MSRVPPPPGLYSSRQGRQQHGASTSNWGRSSSGGQQQQWQYQQPQANPQVAPPAPAAPARYSRPQSRAGTSSGYYASSPPGYSSAPQQTTTTTQPQTTYAATGQYAYAQPSPAVDPRAYVTRQPQQQATAQQAPQVAQTGYSTGVVTAAVGGYPTSQAYPNPAAPPAPPPPSQTTARYDNRRGSTSSRTHWHAPAPAAAAPARSATTSSYRSGGAGSTGYGQPDNSRFHHRGAAAAPAPHAPPPMQSHHQQHQQQHHGGGRSYRQAPPPRGPPRSSRPIHSRHHFRPGQSTSGGQSSKPSAPAKPFHVVSRWHADHDVTTSIPPFPTRIPYGMPPRALEAFLIRARIDEITKRLTSGSIHVDPAEIREASPEPQFDKLGRRTNSRIQRVKDALTAERSRLVERAYRIHPLYRPPADFKFEAKKLVRKLPIPVEKFPDYNFIGLIIGPRGSTQKRLEKETGAHIAIRGKGSVKSGARGAAAQQSEDPLHVLITADDAASLQRAVDVIEKMLTPIEEGMNEFKRRQLRELARIHGTLRDDSGPVGVPDQEGSLLKQLSDTYGKGRGVREEARLGAGRSGRDRRAMLHGHNVERFDGLDLDDDALDEQFERFSSEVDGVAQSQPWYEFYNVRTEKPVVAPGVDGLKRDHFLFCQQRRRRGCNARQLQLIRRGIEGDVSDESDVDVWTDDEDDDLFVEEELMFGDPQLDEILPGDDHHALFDQVFPPGTIEEQQYYHFLESMNPEDSAPKPAARPPPPPPANPPETDPSALLKKVKKTASAKAVASDVPPWLL